MRRFSPARAALALGCSLAAVAALAQQTPTQEGMPETFTVGTTPITIQGFGDFDYLSRSDTSGKNGFKDGAFEFFVTSRLTDRWTVLAELVFEPDQNTLSNDLERFQFNYEQSDALRIAVGRVHSPLLRWSVTNHHGLFMETPVDNPIIARWEDKGGLWPLHFVGVTASGRLFGPLGLSYALGVGNGRGTLRDEVQVGSDANSSKAYLGTLGIAPESLPGLEASVSAYFDRIPAPGGEIRERDVTGSFSYVSGPAELRSEWSRMEHTPDNTSTTYETRGWYVLGSYRLPPPAQRLRPYVLLEALTVAKGEAYFEGVPSEKAVAAGIRFDANRWIALKGDYRWQEVGDAPRRGIVRLQLAANF